MKAKISYTCGGVKKNCPLKNNNWYIGLSKRKFKTRISEHRDYVKCENLNEPSGEHFNKQGHSIHDWFWNM